MWNFGDDEWAFLIAATAVSVFGGISYYRPLFRVASIGGARGYRGVLTCLPLVVLIPLGVVLSGWADKQVVGHIDYMLLFTLGGTAWIFAAGKVMALLGISIRGDALERHNAAALIAASGGLVAVGLAYALCNVGSGPTIWTTIVPAAVAAGLLGLMVVLIELVGGTAVDAVTIDRDLASGIRLAGALVGCGIILGRAGAGDWNSWSQTWRDFGVHGWPAILLAVAAGITHRFLRPTVVRPQPNCFKYGTVPGALFLGAAVLLAILV